MKTIEEIWPEAFETGQPVRLKGKRRAINRNDTGFVLAWFECRDGRRYYLTQDELQAYMPDVVIHPDF
jgi:hypothetical protein